MVRMIDANRLKDAIYTDFWEHFTQCHDSDQTALIDMVMDDIDEMPTLAPPNEWVSVEDRLPAENEPVLCITNGKPRENITLIATYQIGSWNATEGWIIDEWPDWEDAEVSWWMTIPEPHERRPPEGEENT